MDYVPYLINRSTDLSPGSIEAHRYHASPRDRRQEGRVSIPLVLKIPAIGPTR